MHGGGVTAATGWKAQCVAAPAAMPGGGYLYHSDHSIPKDVSFQRYSFVMQCVKEYGRY